MEKTNPTVEQSQPRHGLSHPGSIPLSTAAKKGTPQAFNLNKGVRILSPLEYEYCCGITMFSITGVLLPILTDCSLPVRKSRSQSERVGCRPNVDSLWVTLCWITVLKAQLEAAKHPDGGVFVFLVGKEIKELGW